VGPSAGREQYAGHRESPGCRSPDFVVLLGDLVTGEDLVNATNATAYSDMLLEPIVTRGIPLRRPMGTMTSARTSPGTGCTATRDSTLCRTHRGPTLVW